MLIISFHLFILILVSQSNIVLYIKFNCFLRISKMIFCPDLLYVISSAKLGTGATKE